MGLSRTLWVQFRACFAAHGNLHFASRPSGTSHTAFCPATVSNYLPGSPPWKLHGMPPSRYTCLFRAVSALFAHFSRQTVTSGSKHDMKPCALCSNRLLALREHVPERKLSQSLSHFLCWVFFTVSGPCNVVP